MLFVHCMTVSVITSKLYLINGNSMILIIGDACNKTCRSDCKMQTLYCSYKYIIANFERAYKSVMYETWTDQFDLQNKYTPIYKMSCSP